MWLHAKTETSISAELLLFAKREICDGGGLSLCLSVLCFWFVFAKMMIWLGRVDLVELSVWFCC